MTPYISTDLGKQKKAKKKNAIKVSCSRLPKLGL
jgi:hypothetical protein